MAKTSNRPRLAILLLAVVGIALLAYAWLHKRQPPADTASKPAVATAPKESATAVPADRIDPAREGATVSVSGKLAVRTPARDTQLGVSADAVMLLRYAEMLQWREQCAGEQCDYKPVWSPQLINSSKFRVQEGHKNPARMPLTTARFAAGEVRLGAFLIDAGAIGNYRLGAALQEKPVPYPVTSAQLPSNLAISFREANGALYAGNDPAHPVVGDLRVSYRVIPAVDVEMTGVQRGDRLLVQKSTSAQRGG